VAEARARSERITSDRRGAEVEESLRETELQGIVAAETAPSSLCNSGKILGGGTGAGTGVDAVDGAAADFWLISNVGGDSSTFGAATRFGSGSRRTPSKNSGPSLRQFRATA